MPTCRLTDRAVASLKPVPGKQVDYFDARLTGFGVRVSPRGRKTFIVFYRTDVGRLRRQTLGVYPRITLAKARETARGELHKADSGRDPATEQEARRTETFGALADLYIEKHAKRKKRSWRADARMIRRQLATWRDRPVETIRRRDVNAVLDTIVTRGAPILANRVLSLISKILNFGIDQDWLESNVAAKLAKPSTEQSRTRVLSEAELKTVWKYLDAVPDPMLPPADQRIWQLTRATLKLRLVTGQRGQEVLAMRGADVDGAWWTIPAAVAKNKLPHRVPLSPMAVAILTPYLPEDPTAFVFAGIRGTRQRRGALATLGIADVRPHDFRRSMATLMASGGVPRLVIAKILNHVDASITAVYDRASYDTDKQAALLWWQEKLTAIISGKPTTKVLPFMRSA